MTYAAYLDYRKAVTTTGTVANIIERFTKEMAGLKPLGETHLYALRALARRPIGLKMARALTKADIIEHCRERRRSVSAATANQDIVYLTGALKYAGSAWDDCEDVSAASIEAAKPFLSKNDLIGKSAPRDRRPLEAEHARLLDYFAAQQNTTIDMVRVAEWQIKSARRIGETCRLLWADWNRNEHTIIVRRMKDPRKRNKSKVVALPPAAQAMLEAMWGTRDPNEPRIFPYTARSCSARYTRAKHDLGIENLHLHDSRRDCGTRLVEDLGYSPAEAIQFTGHETVAVFERTYLRMKPELLRHGPLAKRQASEQAAV